MTSPNLKGFVDEFSFTISCSWKVQNWGREDFNSKDFKTQYALHWQKIDPYWSKIPLFYWNRIPGKLQTLKYLIFGIDSIIWNINDIFARFALFWSKNFYRLPSKTQLAIRPRTFFNWKLPWYNSKFNLFYPYCIIDTIFNRLNLHLSQKSLSVGYFL